jgi:hypothetical protein
MDHLSDGSSVNAVVLGELFHRDSTLPVIEDILIHGPWNSVVRSFARRKRWWGPPTVIEELSHIVESDPWSRIAKSLPSPAVPPILAQRAAIA